MNTTPPDPPPLRPDEPYPADCCGEGCARCVFDVYDEAMERYEAELAAWRARQPPDSRTPHRSRRGFRSGPDVRP